MKQKFEEGYITPEEVKARGLIKRRDGTLYQLNTLEKYAQKGWLDFGDKRFDKEQRLEAAARFHEDFIKSRIVNMSSIDISQDRVDGGAYKDIPEYVWDARKRFAVALKKIDRKYWWVISQVVIEDRPLQIVKNTSGQYNHDLELAKEYLCLGLDELVFHYGLYSRGKRRVIGYAVNDFWDNIDDYCRGMVKR